MFQNLIFFPNFIEKKKKTHLIKDCNNVDRKDSLSEKRGSSFFFIKVKG